jgi:xanthine dehydrogenase accessory factor
VLPQLSQWVARGDRVALATVVDVRRSAPRPPGAKMAVNEHGEIAGAVSGGCVEGAVVEIADGVIRGGAPQLTRFGIADEQAWDVGLPCGGEIDVWVQAYEPGRFGQIASEGGRAAEVTALDGARPGTKLLVEADGARSGSLGAPELDDEAARIAAELLWAERSERRDALFFDVVAPSPRLIIFGAVDVAASLCRLAVAIRRRSAQALRRRRSLPRRRGGDRGVAGGSVRTPGRDRSRHLDRRPDARSQAR